MVGGPFGAPNQWGPLVVRPKGNHRRLRHCSFLGFLGVGCLDDLKAHGQNGEMRRTGSWQGSTVVAEPGKGMRRVNTPPLSKSGQSNNWKMQWNFWVYIFTPQVKKFWNFIPLHYFCLAPLLGKYLSLRLPGPWSSGTICPLCSPFSAPLVSRCMCQGTQKGAVLSKYD